MSYDAEGSCLITETGQDGRRRTGTHYIVAHERGDKHTKNNRKIKHYQSRFIAWAARPSSVSKRHFLLSFVLGLPGCLKSMTELHPQIADVMKICVQIAALDCRNDTNCVPQLCNTLKTPHEEINSLVFRKSEISCFVKQQLRRRTALSDSGRTK